MTAAEVPSIATNLLFKLGLTELGWRFAFDHAKRRAGRCQYSTKTISLSKHYVALNVATNPEDVLDTILHEIAHALAPGDHHGDMWKAKCIEIGARPKRCYDSSLVKMPTGKVCAICDGCRNKFRRHKLPPRGRRMHCVACGPQRGALVFITETIKKVVPLPPAPATPVKLRGM